MPKAVIVIVALISCVNGLLPASGEVTLDEAKQAHYEQFMQAREKCIADMEAKEYPVKISDRLDPEMSNPNPAEHAPAPLDIGSLCTERANEYVVGLANG